MGIVVLEGGAGGGYQGGSSVASCYFGKGGYSYNSGSNKETLSLNYGDGYAKITQLYTGGEVVLNGTTSSTHTFFGDSYDPAISSSSAAIGGSSPFSYQWQVSTDGVYYSDVSGVTSLEYNPPSVSQTTFYRRKVTDNSSNVQYSNVIEIHKMSIETSTIVESGTKYTVVQYKGDGDSSFIVPSGVSSISFLVVGGGGGGGNGHDNAGGAGGGGGMVRNGELNVTPGQSYALTVGGGGTGGASARTTSNGTAGGNSVFGSITSLGGGAGAASRVAAPGGTANSGGTAQVGTTTAPGGGYGTGGGNDGGGGGGATSAGDVGGTNTYPNYGGAGLTSTISGNSVSYGNGGGGGYNGGPWNGAAGTANTGNGGSGGSSPSSNSAGGGNGGSGIVIVKYKTPCTDPSLTISSTLTINYGDNITLSPSSTSTGTIAYTSSQPSVASINSSTGEINALSIGTTTISISQAVQGDYCADTATMVLTVAKKPITVNGITANDKEYDSTTSVVLNSDNLSYNGGIINGDDVTSYFYRSFF
jgi:hypothetical protein